MQPFNGTSLREKCYKVLSPCDLSTIEISALAMMARGMPDLTFFRSSWFTQHSVRSNSDPGSLDAVVVKSTINSFHISLFKTLAPNIEHIAVLRNYIDTLKSFAENGMDHHWFKDGIGELHKIIDFEFIPYGLRSFLPLVKSDWHSVALLLATRQISILRQIPYSRIIFHEKFSVDPLAACSIFFREVGVTDISLEQTSAFKSKDFSIWENRGVSRAFFIDDFVLALSHYIHGEITEAQNREKSNS